MQNIVLSSEQAAAVYDVGLWYRDSARSRHFFIIQGRAGVGKSTIVPSIVMELNKLKPVSSRVKVCSLAGKAVARLREIVGVMPGVDVTTIHGMMYRPEKPDDYTKWVKIQFLEAPLIIVDESSMLSRAIVRDILSFGILTIFIGDPFQLPPIEDDLPVGQTRKTLMDLPPDVFLVTPQRHLVDSKVLQLANMVRSRPVKLPSNLNADNATAEVVICDVASLKMTKRLELCPIEETVLVVYRNTDRVKANSYLRKMFQRGEEGTLNPGEQLICLHNDHWNKVYNGQIVKTLLTEPVQLSARHCELTIDDLHGGCFPTRIDLTQFGKVNTLRPAKYRDGNVIKFVGLYDYAYSLTAHKAQGSSWTHVLLMLDSGVFDKLEMRRWLYTVLTRATKYVTLVYGLRKEIWRGN